MTAQLCPLPSPETGRRDRPLLRQTLLAALVTAWLPISAVAQSSSEVQANAGPLDTPLTEAIVIKDNSAPGRRPARAPSNAPGGLRPTSPATQGAGSLQSAVRVEQDNLERLPRDTLNARALRSERAAQIALGVSFAKEAALLGFSVTAANSAASDAARWYHQAASQGFPGAPSLDLAGVRHYPIRASRTPLK